MASTLSNVSARNTAFTLYQLDSPAVHPHSVIRCIKSLTANKPAISTLAQSDPAVAMTMLNLCREQKIEFAFDNLNFDNHINKIPNQKILKTFLNIKTFDIDNLHSHLPLGELNNISAARAYAARLIAQKTNTNESIAFLSALFADIGLFALAELYPKSMSQMFAESNGDGDSLLRLEKENLGLTHNIISRQLAQKWLLPQAVADSAWLYCTQAIHKLENLDNIEIIFVVRLADRLVKNINNGVISSIPSLSQRDLDEIKEKVRYFLTRLNETQEKQQDSIFRQALISFVEKSTGQNLTQFQSVIWNAVKPAVSAIEAAAIICNQICKIFDARKACIYLNAKNETVKTANGKTEFLALTSLPTFADIDFEESITSQINLDSIGRLFIESNNDFDISTIAPQISQILSAKSAEEYNLSIVQTLLDDSAPQVQPPVQQPAADRTEAITEKIVESSDQMREIIAEIAAGAAHELNNPLTVISGRAQLLKQQETDETKLLMLNQITEKTGQAYEIVGQLMSYARPVKPNIRTVSPFIMINNCLEKINAHYLEEPLDITIDSSIENLSDIEVDADQIAEAIAQIIYNALESYESGNGPVIISGSENTAPGFVQIRIQDQGCGMTEETLQKAAEPFYSDKPAGRQRGMGLAIASSLLRNNSATISIESQIDKGTIATIRLPKTTKSQ